MELTNEFRVRVPVEQAWSVLTDVERIAPCLPGAQLQEVEGDLYRGVVKVKVGPITAQYRGTATFVEQDGTAHRAVLRAEGRDVRGQGNANATVTATLEADGAATAVRVVTDLTITGKVAQFGRGVLADVSGKLIGQFVENLERDVLADAGNDVLADAGNVAAAPSIAPSPHDGGIAADISLEATEELLAAHGSFGYVPATGHGTDVGAALAEEATVPTTATEPSGPPTPSTTTATPPTGTPAQAAAAATGSAEAGSAATAPTEAGSAATGSAEAGSAATGSAEAGSAATAPRPPAVAGTPGIRRVDAPEAQPVDLFSTAGAPVLKRVLPLLGVVGILVAIIWRVGHRRD